MLRKTSKFVFYTCVVAAGIFIGIMGFITITLKALPGAIDKVSENPSPAIEEAKQEYVRTVTGILKDAQAKAPQIPSTTDPKLPPHIRTEGSVQYDSRYVTQAQAKAKAALLKDCEYWSQIYAKSRNELAKASRDKICEQAQRPMQTILR